MQQVLIFFYKSVLFFESLHGCGFMLLPDNQMQKRRLWTHHEEMSKFKTVCKNSNNLQTVFYADRPHSPLGCFKCKHSPLFICFCSCCAIFHFHVCNFYKYFDYIFLKISSLYNWTLFAFFTTSINQKTQIHNFFIILKMLFSI